MSRFASAPALCLAVLAGCSGPEEPSFRVAVAKFQQETCTFCPGGDAPTEDWTVLGPLLSGTELIDAGGSYVRGFAAQARDYGDMELIGLTSPDALFGGSSRSWSTLESFETFVGGMIEELEAAMPVDGVFLALHGALAVRDVAHPEAEIARRFREVVGPDVPIAATFDLHGNEDEAFLAYADFSFVTKRFPHYDAALQGERAARALHRTMNGDYDPTTATRKPGVVTPTVLQWTGAPPASEIMERARRWENRTPDAFVSVFFGFPWSDVPDLGATVQVMTNGDQELADEIADDMSDYIWRVREDFAGVHLPLPTEAARLAREAVAEGRIPIAVGDYSDRPGDATHIIRAFDSEGIGRALYGAITSPAALDSLEEAGARAGDDFDGAVGGFTPSGGEPYHVRGRIRYLGPWAGYDYTAAIEYGDGNLVVLAPAYTQITNPHAFEFGDVDLADYDVFVVKSRVHFRRGFDETGYAPTILVVDAPEPFVGTRYLDALTYENVELSTMYPYGVPEARR